MRPARPPGGHAPRCTRPPTARRPRRWAAHPPPHPPRCRTSRRRPGSRRMPAPSPPGRAPIPRSSSRCRRCRSRWPRCRPSCNSKRCSSRRRSRRPDGPGARPDHPPAVRLADRARLAAAAQRLPTPRGHGARAGRRAAAGAGRPGGGPAAAGADLSGRARPSVEGSPYEAVLPDEQSAAPVRIGVLAVRAARARAAAAAATGEARPDDAGAFRQEPQRLVSPEEPPAPAEEDPGEVDRVMLAKEFSGLLQVGEDGDED